MRKHPNLTRILAHMPSHSFLRPWFIILATVIFLAAHSVFATDATWNVDLSGNWSNAADWTSNPTVPGGQGSTINLTNNIAGTRTITIDTTSRTVGILNIGDTDASNNFTLAANGGASLILDNGVSNAQINNVSTAGAVDTISAPILLNGSFDINNASTKILTLSGGITSNTAGTKTISNLSSGNSSSNDSVRISGIIGNGSGTVVVTQNSSAGILDLQGANTFTGGVNITSGVLLAKATVAEVAGTSGALGASGNITFTGGALRYGNTNEADYSARFKSSGAAIILDAGGNAITLGGGIDSTNTNGLNIVGTGAITLNGANNYTGGTTLAGSAVATTLNIGSATALSSGGLTITNGTIDNASGSDLVLSNTVTINGSFIFVGSKNLTVTSAATLGTATGVTRAITVNSGTLTVNGNFGNGTTGSAITLHGPGTLVLTGANTYTGITTIDGGGTISVNSIGSTLVAGALGQNGTSITIGATSSGGQLTYTGAGESSSRIIKMAGSTGGAILDQSGAGLLNFSSNLQNSGLAATDERKTLTLQGSTSGTGQFSGNLIDAGLGTAGQTALSIAKAGAGTWILSGNNTYTGSTTITSGRLFINGNNSAATGAVGVTGVLSGTGTVGGAVTVNTSGAIDLRDGGIGTLHLSSTLSIGTGTTNLFFDVNASANDLLAVGSTVTLNATNGTVITINAISGATSLETGSFSIITATGGLSTNNLFTLASSTITVGSNTYNLSLSNSATAETLTIALAGGGNASLLSVPTTVLLKVLADTSATQTVTITNSNGTDAGNYTAAAGALNTGSSTVNPSSGTVGASGTAGETIGYTDNTTVGARTGTALTVTNTSNGSDASNHSTTLAAGSGVYSAASLAVTAGSPAGNVTPFSIGNSGGAFTAPAEISAATIVSGSSQAGFSTSNFASGTIAPGQSTTVAQFDGSHKLNGNYNGQVTVTARNDSTIAGSAAGDKTATYSVTAGVTGNKSINRTDTYSASILSGHAYTGDGVALTGGGYNLTSNLAGSTHLATTAMMLNGTLNATTATNVTMSFDTTSANLVTNAFRTSDILTLSGLNSTSPVSGVQLTDTFVLQLSYDTSVSGVEYLGWNNGTQFVNAVSGDGSGNVTQFGGAGNGEVTGAYSGQTTVGTYGYDPTNHVVWAVLDHTGITDSGSALIAGTNEFTVIPEPGTWGMILGGFGMLAGFQKLRKRRVGI